MKIIKHLNIEFNPLNQFAFNSKVYELTKGNKLEFLISLFNDINWDFGEKFEKILSDNKIDFFKNDYDIEISQKISEDFSKQAELHYENTDSKEDFNFEYKLNENYSEKQFINYFLNNSFVVFDYKNYHFDLQNKLQKDFRTIRYKRKDETIEIEELRDYYYHVYTVFEEFIYTEYEKIKIDNNEPEPEPLDLSDTTAVEKIIYLNELGILDFLRTKTKTGISNGGLASVLSAITGTNPDTIKSSLNRLPKDSTIDNKHPYYTEKTVSKVKTFLTKLGL